MIQMNRIRLQAMFADVPRIDNVDDDLMLQMEGRWYLQYSGCPLWIKEEITTVSFNYHVRHLGEDLVLEDRVEYIRSGKMRFRLGYDYPVEGIANTFRWRGKGINRTFRNHFEVSLLNEHCMVLFFQKTLTSPTSIDVLTPQRIITPEKAALIEAAVLANETVAPYWKEVRRVRQTQSEQWR